ncbi:MAG: hypothetical protein ABSA23_16230 [Anaerolineales bacterium]|jgi:hypothetical protein
MSSSPYSTHRKPGAQPGNSNAVKHGFYAIKPEVITRLDTQVKGEFNDEIDAIRSLSDTTIATFSAIEHPTLEQCQTTLRAVSQAFDTMKGLYVTQKVLYNNQTSIARIMEELGAIPADLD